jgi:TolB-like protein
MLSRRDARGAVPDELRVAVPDPTQRPGPRDHSNLVEIRTARLATEFGDGNPVTKTTICDALSRILASPMFIQSERLGLFLQFTVNATLEGGEKILKEYLIGTEVYNRPTSYRPSEDSIVRSEARRLRSKLKEYYEAIGKNDPVVIDYRPGSYVPVFRSKQKPSLRPSARVPASRARFRRLRGIRVAVIPFQDTPGSTCYGADAQLITDELIHELARTEGILVSAASLVVPLVAKAMDVRTLARELDVQVVFEGSVHRSEDSLRITSRVVSPADGFQVWSERTDTNPHLQDLPNIVRRIASSLVAHIPV